MYFPDFNGDSVECHKCEKENCHSRGKYQRNRKDFEVTSGRCPRLPDKKGFVHQSESENQRNAYSFVHAKTDGSRIIMNVSRLGRNRMLRVYQTKSGNWYFNTKDEHGNKMRRVIIMQYQTAESIIEYMDRVRSDYCLFPCKITDSYV